MVWKIILRDIGDPVHGDPVPVGIAIPIVGQTTPRSLVVTVGGCPMREELHSYGAL